MNKIILYILFLGLFFFTSCEKGEYVNSTQEFTKLKIESLNSELTINSLIYKGNEIKVSDAGEYLLPYEPQDSIDITVVYDKKKPAITEKIKNVSGNNNQTIYYTNPNTLTVAIGPHPLEGNTPPEGKVLTKILNSSKLLAPNNEPIHLAFYDFTDLSDTYNPQYSDTPIDTIFNIVNEIPMQFKEFRKINAQVGWKAKVLTSDKKELLIGGKKVYLFVRMYGVTSKENMFVLDIYTSELTMDLDKNSWLPIPDGGYGNDELRVYMSK